MKIKFLNKINNLNFKNIFSNKNPIDSSENIRYATNGKYLKLLDRDVYEKNINIGEKMDNFASPQNINNKIKEVCYDGIIEPKYSKRESVIDEENCVNTINKFYDENDVLRKKETVFNKNLLLNVCLYNKSGFLTYEANVGFPKSGSDISIGRFYYDGTENENLIKTSHKSLNKKL